MEVNNKVVKQNTSKNSQILKKFPNTNYSVQAVHGPNEKDAMTSRCLDRKEVLHATWRVHSVRAGRFLMFGSPVCADRLSILSIG